MTEDDIADQINAALAPEASILNTVSDTVSDTISDTVLDAVQLLPPKSTSKLDSKLVTVLSSYQTQRDQTQPNQTVLTANQAAPDQAAESLLMSGDGWIAIDAVSPDPERLLHDLQALGFRDASSFGAVVSGKLPTAALAQLNQLESLAFANPVYRPIRNVGRTTSQADLSVRAEQARRNFNLSGAGLRIGVLSDSYDNRRGAARDIASGDLPADIQVLREGSGGSDEGRAMLQLIHDIAPGADLAFHTAFEGEAAFANGILALQEAGVQVIVDDVIYFAEPMFQDGMIAQAVDQVAAAGVSYFSSAGNSGRESYMSRFTPGLELNGLGRLHDFDPGSGIDYFQSISLEVGETLTLSLQWDSPFFSLNPASGGSQSDLDLYLFDENGDILARSISDNLGRDPVEILQFTNSGQTGANPGANPGTNFNLAIVNAGGSNPGLIKYVSFGDGSIDEYDTASSTIFGHANARGANAVGAAAFFQTPAYGSSPAQIESFSSAGGTPILRAPSGERLLSPEIRLKPAIVAPDGTNTTFFGRDISQDADLFPNFFGTSAAAPHAAAVAALLLEANPSLSPVDIAGVLQATALDIDDPSTPNFDVGFDFASGYGLIQADRAVATVLDAEALAVIRGRSGLVGNLAQEFGNAERRDLTDADLVTPRLDGPMLSSEPERREIDRNEDGWVKGNLPAFEARFQLDSQLSSQLSFQANLQANFQFGTESLNLL
ncbi:MAG: S8 family serine peptidase [Pegethrix bostrychoides GSE-TBD4-15B]|jgi:subtilisin family serine protease|uniref:S8 family serine peptidase n=1 Tax=Pegethrix bostrychoides GSE-TBD4-15B TaxID=2839662 RepID=A0A951PAR7_9CYAN|nr:S8 family serine peptidase [Pegethrix bostrychoides GSE-TBD4-15B]